MAITKELFSNNKLSEEDLFYLSQMLKSNLPIKDCLNLLKNDKNETIVSSIIDGLNAGYLINEIMPAHTPKQIADYLLPFMKTLSFSESLELALLFNQRHQMNQKKLISNTAYPFFLLFFSMTALYFFDLYGLDTVLSLIKGFDSNFDTFLIFRVVLRILIYCFYFGVLIITFFIIIFSREKRIRLMYLFLCKLFKDGLVKSYYCGELVSLLVICDDKGYKTKDALELLKSLHSKAIISFLAWHLDDGLFKGGSLKEASNQVYFDPLLTNYISLGSYTGEYISILKNYVILNDTKLQTKLKRFTLVLQTTIYILIGIMIIFVYQVLFLPMQAIINF